ncbi:hypothetical protein OG426_16105 [Streptomyces canus]|uniref:hypothetical protein n=1 Tax=Streptomyces canus TaxID=58343 RepID=UPI00386896D8|nr:hypothetical protein OG426_16105 [Streptomyces canus]
MTTEEIGDYPPYILKKIRLRQELREIVDSLTPQHETTDVPDGHYANPDVPDHEIAAALAQYGRHTGRYRPEH